MAKNDFPKFLGSNRAQTVAKIGGLPLDHNDPWDRAILAESKLLAEWSGLSPDVVKVTAVGTAAYPAGIVTVKRTQLDALFGSLSPENYSTAVFIALAHEFGHLLQFHYFGVPWMSKENRRLLIEAHADFIGGTWIGKRLGDGVDHTSDGALQTGASFKAGSESYPTPYQRARLMMAGMAAANRVQLLEAQMPPDAAYVPFTQRFALQDIQGTMRTVRHTLPVLPTVPPPPVRMYQGPQTGAIRRVQ
jgi:hypothetical protein